MCTAATRRDDLEYSFLSGTLYQSLVTLEPSSPYLQNRSENLISDRMRALGEYMIDPDGSVSQMRKEKGTEPMSQCTVREALPMDPRNLIAGLTRCCLWLS